MQESIEKVAAELFGDEDFNMESTSTDEMTNESEDLEEGQTPNDYHSSFAQREEEEFVEQNVAPALTKPEGIEFEFDGNSRKVIPSTILLTPEKLKELWPALSAPFPEDAVQEGETEDSKGYDTIGYRYQYIFNRLNEVLPGGPANWRFKSRPEIVHVEQSASGKSYNVTVYIEFAIGNTVMYADGHTEFHPIAEAVGYGGATNKDYHAAVAGAFTNACKKVIAELGPGHQAYTGQLQQEWIDNGKKKEKSLKRNTEQKGVPATSRSSSNDLSKEPQVGEDRWPILPFGKYEGKSLYEVYKNNPTYVVEFLAGQINENTHNYWKEAISYLVKHYQEKQQSAS